MIAVVLMSICSVIIGWAISSIYYRKIISNMAKKNFDLISRVKKAEGIILNDVLQFSPDDIEMLKKNMEKESTQKE